MNVIGLRFLARHLVTLNFPKRTMYLKRTSPGPLVDEDAQQAAKFLKGLKQAGELPGWATDEQGEKMRTHYVAGFYADTSHFADNRYSKARGPGSVSLQCRAVVAGESVANAESLPD
jgi:hypothetical protein